LGSRFAGAASKLHWSKLESSSVAFNKSVVVGFFLCLVLPALLHLPLTGRGDEGKEMELAWALGARGGGSVSAMACLRDPMQRSFLSSSSASLLLSIHGGKRKKEAKQRRAVGSFSASVALALRVALLLFYPPSLPWR
jgi:hypothetical protein